MQKKLIPVLLSIVILLIGGLYTCSRLLKKEFNESKKIETRHTYFIQLIWNCRGISQIREAIAPVINKIIHEELNLKEESPLFLGKDRQALTLYYLDNMHLNGENIFVAKLESMLMANELLIPRSTSIAPRVDFFGEGQDELVIMINDPTGELTALNNKIKTIAHLINQDYREKNHDNLFDISKSEQFPFVPHIGLGRIRSNSIKQHIKDHSQVEKTFEHIKGRIRTATLKIVADIITSENQSISYTRLSLFCLSKRVNIKEYQLENFTE